MIATVSEGTKVTFLKNAHTHRKCIIGKYYKECVLSEVNQFYKRARLNNGMKG